MSSSHAEFNVVSLAHVALLLVVGVVALVGNTGCDTTGWGLGGYGYGDYGWIDTDTVQSVIDYRQDVMENSANAWDEYIRS